MSKFLDQNGLLYFWQKVKNLVTGSVPTKTSQLTNDSGYITKTDVPDATTIDSALSSTSTNPVQNKVVNTALGGKVDKVSGKGLSTNDYTTDEKNKLAGIATGANKYTLPAATASTLGGVKTGDNITNNSGVISLSKENVTDALGYTPPTKDTTYSEATTSADGLMSSEDKAKLDGIAAGANKYTLPTAGSALGGVKTTSTVTSTSGLTAVPIISGVPYYKDTTYGAATSSANGLMSKADKAKLDAFGAASTYALKSDITGLYKYKGSKATVSALPTTGNAVGDVYNVEASGMNYVWTGSEWDALGEIFTIDAITNSEIDTIVAS